ncbi:MAG: transposase [Bryobacterales bacterium]
MAFQKLTEKPVSPENTGRLFVEWDRLLDKAALGPTWLKEPRIARIAADAIEHGHFKLGFYALHAYVVMSNHIHLLLTPAIDVRRIMRGLKGITANQANRILRRRGQPFWQDESFDHWVRDGLEFERIVSYIEFNPVKAGLVELPEEWPWSSARGTDNPVCSGLAR